MRFDKILKLDSGAAGPDPIDTPQDVPVNARVYSKTERSAGRMVSRWLLGVTGPLGTALDVELYSLVSEVNITPGTSAIEDAPDPVDDVWIRFAVESLPTGEIIEVLGGPAGGTIYVRVTGGNAGERSVYVACVDG